MQLYTATIRLAGSLYNEVQRDDLTAPEISILKRIHGPDGVVRIAAGKHVDRDDNEERERLRFVYARALSNIKNVGTIEAILGPEGVPLAKTVPGVDSLAAPKTGRRAKIDPVEPEAPADDEPVKPDEFQ